jgi:hypothetical protein
MKVGHHTAYRLAVSVFCGETGWETAMAQLENETDDLNYTIALYGLCGYLDFIGRKNDSACYLKALLRRDTFWPCVSYLAAWNDAHP